MSVPSHAVPGAPDKSFISKILVDWYWLIAVLITIAIWALLSLGMLPRRDSDGSFATHPYGLTTAVENDALDLLFQLRNVRAGQRNRGLNEPITIIDIDEKAIKTSRVRPQKWPRDWYARLIDRANDGGANVIGLDVLLSEEGGVSLEDRQRDLRLVESMRLAGKVVIARKAAAGGFEAVEPLSIFADAAWAVGFVDAPLDSDGFVRTLPVFFVPRPGEDVSLSFAARVVEGFRASEGFDRKFAELTGKGMGEEEAQMRAAEFSVEYSSLKPAAGNAFVCGDLTFPLRNDRFLQLDFRGHAPAFQRISAADILFDESAKVPDSLFRNRIVLIGESYLGGSDLYPTPFYESSSIVRVIDKDAPKEPVRTPGVELHATSAATILFGGSLSRPGYKWQVVVLILPLALAALAVFWLRTLWGLIGVIFIAAGTLFISCWVFNSKGLILPLANAWLGVGLLTPLGMGLHYARERVRRSVIEFNEKLVMDLFSRFVSDDVAAKMWELRGQTSFAGERRIVTVIFTDIRGFTTISESATSESIVEWLNDYFGRMYAIVSAHGGHINKFLGDGLMIVFGAPLGEDDQKDARSAVACGLAMLEAVEKMNDDWKGTGRPPIKIGVGINTGEATCGVVGAKRRLEYTLIGDTVNLASRLESSTKELGVPIVISESTALLLGDEYQVKPLGDVKVKGKNVPTSVFTVKDKPTNGENVLRDPSSD